MDRHERRIKAGRWLREQREHNRIEARDLAAKLGVPLQTLYNWESGRTDIGTSSGDVDDRAAQIANILDMPEVDVRRGLGLWVPDDGDTREFQAEDEDIEQLMRRVRQMPREDRRALLRLLRASDQMTPPERTTEEPPEERRH